ncbi:hypothetical protein HYS31_02845 [Candidatus Woesearchaeota archaeon]|nr:hypothetical protein [Candidatus Woesearchaeota archaeon]
MATIVPNDAAFLFFSTKVILQNACINNFLFHGVVKLSGKNEIVNPLTLFCCHRLAVYGMGDCNFLSGTSKIAKINSVELRILMAASGFTMLQHT